jgi:hypothetical protein
MSRASSSSARNLTSVSFLVLAVFVLLLVLIVKAYMVFIRTPNRVRLVMDDACASVDAEAPLSEQRAQFMQRWESASSANSCPEAITSCDSCGFEQDSFFIIYTDSIELPGLPAYHRTFSLVTPLCPPAEGR